MGSSRLTDKVHPMQMHVNYPLRNCKVQRNLDQAWAIWRRVTRTFTKNCDKSSRCRTEPNYFKTSREILTSLVAIRLLTETIHSMRCVHKRSQLRSSNRYILHGDLQ